MGTTVSLHSDEKPVGGLDRDTLFDLLSSARRQYVLRYLCDESPEEHVEELARLIAAEETAVPPAEVPSEDVRRVYISLYQTHVPKLEENGLLRFDPDERVVTLSAPTETRRALCELLGVGRGTGTTGRRVLGAWAAVSVLAVSALGVGSVGASPPAFGLSVAVLLALSNLLLAAMLYYHRGSV